MLTRLFNQEKPILFLGIGVFISFFFLYYVYFNPTLEGIERKVWITIPLLGICILSMLLIDFIGRKNNISKNNTYKISLFAFFIATIPETFLYEKTVISNFFILLALRRIISMRTGVELQKKIFDASLWIALASCFYFWSVFYFLVLFAAIFVYQNNNFKYWITPFVGIFSIIVLSNIYTLLVQNAFYTPLDWVRSAGFNFSFYHDVYVVPLTLYVSFTFWSLGFVYLEWKKKSLKNKQTIFLITITLIASFLLVIFTGQKNGSELLFLAFPMVALMANYMVLPKDFIFKEIVFWILLVIPITLLFI